MKKLNIHFVRHGETYLNVYKRMQGWSDTPLTQKGEQDARKCGERVRHIAFDKVYTSDSGRTMQTAKIIVAEQRQSNLSIQPMMAFRETFFGSFEGEFDNVSWNRVAESQGFGSTAELLSGLDFDKVMDAFKEADPYGDAENYQEFWQRLDGGLQTIIDESSQIDKEEANILVVTHGNTIRNIVYKYAPSVGILQEIMNGSITTFEVVDGEFLLQAFNQI